MTARRDGSPWSRLSRLSLRARLSLLAAAAVAVAVVAVSGLAWLTVRAQLYRQLDGQLDTDARIIASQPLQWRDSVPAPLPDQHDDNSRGRHDRRDIGPRWQILDQAGTPYVPTGATPVLPVTPNARRVAAGTLPRSWERVDIGPLNYRMLTLPAAGGGAVQVALPHDPVDRTLGQLGLLLAAGCLVGVAGAALLGRSVARAGLAPVERLTGAVEHVTATRDLQAAIPVDGEDEIARLARSFNTMLAALDSSRAAQRMLVEDAGHELRTPLTSLRTNIELLVRAETGAATGRTLAADDRARLLRDLEVQVVELAQLTNELVDLAQEDPGPEPVEPVDLADVVSAAVDRIRLRFPAVEFDTALRPATVAGRPAVLERTVLNLLDNAAKWSPPAGTVRVDAARRLPARGGPVRMRRLRRWGRRLPRRPFPRRRRPPPGRRPPRRERPERRDARERQRAPQGPGPGSAEHPGALRFQRSRVADPRRPEPHVPESRPVSQPVLTVSSRAEGGCPDDRPARCPARRPGPPRHHPGNDARPRFA